MTISSMKKAFTWIMFFFLIFIVFFYLIIQKKNSCYYHENYPIKYVLLINCFKRKKTVFLFIWNSQNKSLNGFYFKWGNVSVCCNNNRNAFFFQMNLLVNRIIHGFHVNDLCVWIRGKYFTCIIKSPEWLPFKYWEKVHRLTGF